MKHPRPEKRAGEWCHGNWERLVPCYWALGRVQSLISSLTVFFFLRFQRALESSSEVLSRWECMVKQTRGQEWAGLGRAAPSFCTLCTEVGLGGPEAQWPRAPAKRLWGAFSGQKWKLEGLGWDPGWRLTTKAAEKVFTLGKRRAAQIHISRGLRFFFFFTKIAKHFTLPTVLQRW